MDVLEFLVDGFYGTLHQEKHTPDPYHNFVRVCFKYLPTLVPAYVPSKFLMFATNATTAALPRKGRMAKSPIDICLLGRMPFPRISTKSAQLEFCSVISCGLDEIRNRLGIYRTLGLQCVPAKCFHF